MLVATLLASVLGLPAAAAGLPLLSLADDAPESISAPPVDSPMRFPLLQPSGDPTVALIDRPPALIIRAADLADEVRNQGPVAALQQLLIIPFSDQSGTNLGSVDIWLADDDGAPFYLFAIDARDAANQVAGIAVMTDLELSTGTAEVWRLGAADSASSPSQTISVPVQFTGPQDAVCDPMGGLFYSLISAWVCKNFVCGGGAALLFYSYCYGGRFNESMHWQAYSELDHPYRTDKAYHLSASWIGGSFPAIPDFRVVLPYCDQVHVGTENTCHMFSPSTGQWEVVTTELVFQFFHPDGVRTIDVKTITSMTYPYPSMENTRYFDIPYAGTYTFSISGSARWAPPGLGGGEVSMAIGSLSSQYIVAG